MRRAVLSLICLAIVGCTSRELPSEALPSELELATPGGGRSVVAGERSIRPISIDLGHILSRGQVIQQEFRVKNPGTGPLRLIRAEASVPCCSSVEALPQDPLPAGGEAPVLVTYRPNFNEGGKRLRFSVTTDSPAAPTIELILTATLHPSWSFRPVAGSTPIPVGEVGKLRYRATRNRDAREDRSEPAVSLDPEDSARLVLIGPPVEAKPEAGFIRTSREIEVETNATTATGLHRAAMVFRWADGRVVREELMWVVEPAVSVVPSGLVLQPSAKPTSQTLVVRSGSGPIRILEVSGPMISEPVALPAEAAEVQRLVLKLDSSAEVAGGGSSIRILTDHRTQPDISIKVLTLRTVGGGAP